MTTSEVLSLAAWHEAQAKLLRDLAAVAERHGDALHPQRDLRPFSTLSVRARKGLWRLGITDAEGMRRLTLGDLQTAKGVGPTTIEEIRKYLGKDF